MQIRKAERKKAKLRLGLGAPSGAGKTIGALLLAFGITGDWSKIGLIDTENGSGELYVGHTVHTPEGAVTIGEYLYCRIEPDYEVSKYIDAQKSMEKAGVEVVIHDSTSHAWAGAGGLLDKQGKIADKSGNSYTAWRSITPEHNLFVETMLGSPCHIIATMRSKQEYVLETNEKGKQVPKKVGMAPVQREGMEYEFTVMLDIDMKHIATASKDRTSIFDGRFFQISPKTGQQLREWLELGKEPEKTIEQLTKEFIANLDDVKSAEELDDVVKANVLFTSRLAVDRPGWHKDLINRIELKRMSFAPTETTPAVQETAASAPVNPPTTPEEDPLTIPASLRRAPKATQQVAEAAE